jgi:uncharacterized membrane protein
MYVMRTTLVAYFATLLAFLLLDGVWLGLLMGSTYKAQLGSMMLDQPLPVPAVAFYLLYILGCVVFVVRPALSHGGWQRAARLGALLGLVAYGTYDLSNWATLQGWPASLALMDMAWGCVATAIACSLGVLGARLWGGIPQ